MPLTHEPSGALTPYRELYICELVLLQRLNCVPPAPESTLDTLKGHHSPRSHRPVPATDAGTSETVLLGLRHLHRRLHTSQHIFL